MIAIVMIFLLEISFYEHKNVYYEKYWGINPLITSRKSSWKCYSKKAHSVRKQINGEMIKFIIYVFVFYNIDTYKLDKVEIIQFEV